MTVVMIAYCESLIIKSVLLNKTNIKAVSITYTEKLYCMVIWNKCCPVLLLHKRVVLGNTMIGVMIFIFLLCTLPT